MQVPVDIRFRNMPASRPLDAAVRRRIRRLDALFPFVLSWQVTLEDTPAHGAAARMTAHLTGSSVAAARAFGPDLQAAVRDAFRAVEHELQLERGQARTRATAWMRTVRGDTAALRLQLGA